MRTIDNDPLEQVLHALNDVRPNAHMQTRLLAKLEAHRAQVATKSAWRRLLPVAVPALAVLAVATFAVEHRTSKTLPMVQRANATSPAAEAVVATEPKKPLLPMRRKPQGASTAMPFVAVRAVVVRADVSQPGSLDEVAAAEMRMPSLPAPTLPPTPEERLLQRTVQRDNGVELAELMPSVREAGYARDRADFQKFFAPRPLVVIPGPPEPQNALPSGDDHDAPAP